MAFNFSSAWTDEIAETSTDPVFQNATVEITFVVEEGEKDVDTGEVIGRVIATLYEGRARIIAVRSSIFQQASSQMNSHVSEFVRVQLPKNSVDRVYTGATVRILASDDTPALVGRRLMVMSDLHGASSASRTLECGYDNDQMVP